MPAEARRRFRQESEGGFVLVWFAFSAIALLGMAGFAVDLGNWYLHISRTQNAADAAALAGAVHLPEDPAAAHNAASSVLKKNKVDVSTASYVGPDPNAPSFMMVTLRGTVASSFISVLGIDVFNYERTGIAAWRGKLAMGSPDNVLGQEPAAFPQWSTRGVPLQYWLSQNTFGRTKEQTDRWGSARCAGADFCTGSKNDEFDPTGQSFVVDIAPGTTGWLAIEVFDAPISAEACSGTCTNDSISGGVQTTSFEVKAPNSENPINVSAGDSGCQPRNFATNDPASSNQWSRICTLYVDGSVWHPGEYTVHMSMPNSNSVSGKNNYSLRAAILTTPTGPLDKGKTKGIDLYAPERLVTRHEPATVSDFYIVKVPATLAGSEIEVQLYDFGEGGAEELKFYWADGSAEPVACELVIATLGQTMSATNGKCTFDTSINHEDFSSRVVTVTIPIPESYGCVNASMDSCWLNMQASYNAAGFSNPEGSSISVGAPGSPLRLHNQGRY